VEGGGGVARLSQYHTTSCVSLAAVARTTVIGEWDV